MDIFTIATTIFWVINLNIVETRFFIESMSHLDNALPPKNALFLYKCSKTLTQDRTKVFINCVPVTSSREKSKIYQSANFYSVTNAELLSNHIIGIRGRLVLNFNNDLWIGYLPVAEVRRKSSRSKNKPPPSADLPEVHEFPHFELLDMNYENCEERVCEIGVPNFVPISNLDAVSSLVQVIGINDISIFWKIDGFGSNQFGTFMSIMNRIVVIYFEQVHRTPEMIKKKTYPEYVIALGRQDLSAQERWNFGVEDIQLAMKDTMDKMIDPCAMYQVSSRMPKGACFKVEDANKHCLTYCQYLKAAFLVFSIPGECSTIQTDQGSCQGSVCVCTGIGTSGFACVKRNKFKPLSMHACNNSLRLKVMQRQLKANKQQIERRKSAVRKIPKTGGETMPWQKKTKKQRSSNDFTALSPGSSPLSDRNSPGRSAPGSPWDG